MTSLPHFSDLRRPPRLRLAEHTPAVLRMDNGTCTTAELQVISLTGGLLSLAAPITPSLTSKLLFISSSGPVVGSAEMLQPLTHVQQPFRFTSMDGEYMCRLQSVIQTALYPTLEQDEWIRKYRAAVALIEPPRQKRRWLNVAAILALITSASAFAAYLHWVK